MSDTSVSYFLFSLAAGRYAVPLMAVEEVATIGPITPVPFMPDYFRGIMNLRGRVVSVLDLRAKLGLPAVITAETSMLVMDEGGGHLGVIVDSVDRVITFEAGSVNAEGRVEVGCPQDWLTGIAEWGGSLVVLLDVKKMISSVEPLNRPEAA